MTSLRRPTPEPTPSSVPLDQQVARLTAKAELIVEELDGVVQQMATLLRRKHDQGT